MKKIILTLLIPAMLFLSSCHKNGDFVGAAYIIKNMNSSSGFVVNVTTGETRFFRDENTVIYPASTTKLLTALCALDVMQPDALVTPGDEVYMVSEGSSFAYVRPNHTLTVEMLIEGMLLPSGNDAAYALSAACGRTLAGDDALTPEEAVDEFVSYMNEYAASIGCTGTNFMVPDGYAGAKHHSTLHDMAIISEKAAENEIIAKYASLQTDDVTYASGHVNTWVNTNKMLDPESKYYNENVVGLKTGSLEDSYSLITLYDDGELRMIIGVFDSSTDKGRYEDTEEIINSEKSVYEIEHKS